MLPAVDGLAPGDVLIIGPDGRLAGSSEPFQTSVAGVYSTAPGLVAGMPETGAAPGSIPLAMTASRRSRSRLRTARSAPAICW